MFSCTAKKEHLIPFIFWSCFSMLCYHLTLFRPLPSYPYFRSSLFLCALLALSIAIEYILTTVRERITLNKVVTILLPYEIYTALAYWNYLKHFPFVLLILFFLSVSGSVLFFFLVPVHQVRASDHNRFFLSSCLRKQLLVIRAICTICGVLVLIMGLILDINGGIPSRNHDQKLLTPHADTDIISENLDVLINLSESHWDPLSLKDRISLLQTVADIETARLGMPHSLFVKADYLKDSQAGTYNHRTKTITIALPVLERTFSENAVSDALEIITHECHHAYTHTLVELYDASNEQYKMLSLFDDIRHYKQEYRNYKSGGEGADFYDYYSQRVERAARAHSQKATQEYLEAINAYLSQHHSESSYDGS